MPSIDDVFGQLKDVNTNLTTVQAELTKINTTLTNGFGGVLQAMQKLVTLSAYADKALWHLSKQDETIICNLEKIAKQTCESLNEEHVQTKLQHSIAHAVESLVELYRTVNPAASLEVERLAAMRDRILRCCPEEPPPPVCTPCPCPTPEPLPQPPDVEPPPIT